MNNLIDKNKFTKYVVIFVGIVVLLKLIPRGNLDIKDIVVSSVVLFSLYIIVDNVFINPACKIDKKTEQIENFTPTSNNEIDYKPGECKDCVKRIYDKEDYEKYEYKVYRKYDASGSRFKDGVMKSEIEYSDYNILPVHKQNEEEDNWGYSMLPPKDWYPIPPHPPICVTDQPTDYNPVYTTGAGVSLKEWDNCRRITPGDVINIDYARDKLNSGR